jgi:hypothetical protein
MAPTCTSIAVRRHNRIAACLMTLDCVCQALQDGIPTCGIENIAGVRYRMGQT